MTLEQFITKWTGKGIDFDGAYGFQCMDLIHQYCVEVLGIPNKSVLAQPSAYLVYSNFANVVGHDLFERISNTPSGVPQKGDIMIWGQGLGNNGHIAIFLDGDTKGFNSFDQNYPTGTLPHKQFHNYSYVLGWLHFKQPSSPVPLVTQAELDQIRLDRDNNYRNWQQCKVTLGLTSQELETCKVKVRDLESTLSTQTTESAKQLSIVEERVTKLQADYLALQNNTLDTVPSTVLLATLGKRLLRLDNTYGSK